MASANDDAYERSVAAQVRWRAEVAKETLGIQEVAELLNPEHPDPDRAEQLVESGQLLCVHYEGRARFPGYQFTGTSVREVVAALLALGKRNGIPSWDFCYWMISRSSMFPAHDRPMDHLDEPDQLLAAARYEFEAIW